MRFIQPDRPGDDERDITIRRWRTLAIERGEFCELAHERRVRIMAARVARGVDPWTGGAPAPARSCADVLRRQGCPDQDLVDRAAMLDRHDEREREKARRRGIEPDELEDLVEDDARGVLLRVLEGGSGAA